MAAIINKNLEFSTIAKTAKLSPAFPASSKLKLFDLFSLELCVVLRIKYSVLFCQRWSSKILQGKEITLHGTH